MGRWRNERRYYGPVRYRDRDYLPGRRDYWHPSGIWNGKGHHPLCGVGDRLRPFQCTYCLRHIGFGRAPLRSLPRSTRCPIGSRARLTVRINRDGGTPVLELAFYEITHSEWAHHARSERVTACPTPPKSTPPRLSAPKNPNPLRTCSINRSVKRVNAPLIPSTGTLPRHQS